MSTTKTTTVDPATVDKTTVVQGRVVLDPANERLFKAMLKPHACTIRLQRAFYWAYWRIEETATGNLLQTGFDCDVLKAVDQMAHLGVTLHGVDLYTAKPRPGENGIAAHKADPTAPRCLACGEPGGLPCPKMISDAQKLSIVFKFEPASPQFGHAHLHPGKCRAWLRKALDAVTPAKKEKAA